MPASKVTSLASAQMLTSAPKFGEGNGFTNNSIVSLAIHPLLSVTVTLYIPAVLV